MKRALTQGEMEVGRKDLTVAVRKRKKVGTRGGGWSED